MILLRALLVPVWVATTAVFASPLTDSTCPVVKLDKGTFIGTTANGTNSFLGIPFAHPPSVLYFWFRSPSSLTDPQNLELEIYVSVGLSRLAHTLANTMLPRSVFRAPSKRVLRLPP
jgi:hypothetical protein